ncbi:MAG: membrane protein insertase YidC [Verrucomicrobia bacterium]|jgi:YidC/Oxa1 family membrane protein insertase|nr:membrane protein insertase YidC [Verrucomicrobiota bacterium]
MDRKAIIVIVACVGLMILWTTVLVPKYLTRPLPPGATHQASPAVGAAPSEVTPTQTALTNVLSQVSEPVAPTVHPEEPEESLEVVHDNVRYVFTSHGGGLRRIDLLGYPEYAAAGTQDAGSNGVVSLNAGVDWPVLDLLGAAALQGRSYALTQTAGGVRAEAAWPGGLAVVKEYQFASNYVFTALVRFENRSDTAITLPAHEVSVGAATPLSARDKGQEVGVLWFDGRKTTDIMAAWFANRTLGCLPGTPRSEYAGGNADVVWAAVHNQFFTLATIPETNAPALLIRKQALPKPAPDELSRDTRLNRNPEAYLTSMVRPARSLPPGASVTESYHFYAGPKEYRRLARLADDFGNELDLVMGYGGFFGFFAKGLLLGMNLLNDTFKFGYGMAIIVITVIIKLVFWPLTQASTRSMKRMQALQPQMKALQDKFKDDPAKMNKKLMEFMRENKVSPLGGCLPMLLQIPVFFGFFKMIRSAIELRGARFLWVKDLAQPDTLFMIPGFHFPFNLLPLVMGVTMLVQARLTPPSPGMDPVQQKMMRYMPLMFLVFLYNYSAGLTLYWTVQNLLTILQTKLTKMNEPLPAPAPAAPDPRPAKRRRP